jgi:hypothetical protein
MRRRISSTCEETVERRRRRDAKRKTSVRFRFRVSCVAFRRAFDVSNVVVLVWETDNRFAFRPGEKDVQAETRGVQERWVSRA